MTSRILQVPYNWQRLCAASQRFYYKTKTISNFGYATKVRRDLLRSGTGTNNMAIPPLTKWITSKYCPQNGYATAAMAERLTKTDRTARQPLLTILLDRLLNQNQQCGHINFDLCDKIITELEKDPDANYNQFLSVDNAHFLLRACGTQVPGAPSSNARLEHFQRLWAYLAHHSQLTAGDYITWLHVLQHNRAPLEDFRTFLEEFNRLNAAGEFTLSEVYAELLQTLCESGDIKQTTELLAEMREKELPLNERHFNALVLGNIRNGDMPAGRSVLDNMSAAGIMPSVDTHSLLVCGHLENAEDATTASAKVAEVLTQFHGQFSAKQVVRMIRSFLYMKEQPKPELIKQLVRELPKDFAEGEEVAVPLRHVCIELLHNGKLDTVLHIISNLPTPQFNENQNIDTFGAFLLHELFRIRTCEPTQIIDIAKMLIESGKNTRAMHIVTEIALRRDAEAALPYLKSLRELEALRPHYFWPMILQNHRRSGETGVFNALRVMKSLNVTCDRETITHYVLPHIPLSLQRAVESVKALDEVGLKPSTVLLDVINYLLMHQRLEAAHNLLELYPTKMAVEQLVPKLANAAINVRATRRYQQFAKLLLAMARRNENQKIDWVGQLLITMVQGQMRLRSDLKAMQRFVEEMVKFGLVLSPTAARAVLALLEEQSGKEQDLTAIKEALNKISDANVVLQQSQNPVNNSFTGTGAGAGAASSFVKHPRDMSLEELECHLVELEEKGMNTRGVLRRLLQLYVRDGRLERALEVKHKCDELRVQVSAGMLASTLDLYMKLKDMPNAEKTLQRLQQEFPAFAIDEHKFIDFAALLVHEKQLEKAKEMLQQRATTQKIVGGMYVLKNVWNFLTQVAEYAAQMPDLEPERNLTREHFHFLQKLRYCNAHNAVLGPIVRERLLRGDIKAAVADFQTLARQYKHTPLNFELLSLLVRLCNGHESEVRQYGDVTAHEAQELLNNVTESIAKVHGTMNMNSGLLLAFAASGTDNQLRRLLIDPEFRINHELLLKNCEHLGEEGAVDTLLCLARGARGFGRVINEQKIYNMLLTHFAKSNNYQAALDLYERLEADDDLKISQEFLRNLVHLLRVNNVEIPSGVALQAQIM